MGALKFHDSKTKKLGLSRLPCNISVLSGGSDEIRTRDLRRDRPVKAISKSTLWLESPTISSQVNPSQYVSIRFSPQKPEHFLNMLAGPIGVVRKMYAKLSEAQEPVEDFGPDTGDSDSISRNVCRKT